MERADIIRITQDTLSGRVDQSDVNMVVSEYCLEQGKTPDKVTELLRMMFQHGLYEQYFNYALDYYHRKFAVVKVLSKPDPYGTVRIIHVG